MSCSVVDGTVNKGVFIVDIWHTYRFTVQGVEGRTCCLGLLGTELSINILTGVLYTLVIRGNICAINLYEQKHRNF